MNKIQKKYYNTNDSINKLNATLKDRMIALSEENSRLNTAITELKNLFVDKNFEVNGISSEKVLDIEDNNYKKSTIASNILHSENWVYMKILSNDQLKNVVKFGMNKQKMELCILLW